MNTLSWTEKLSLHGADIAQWPDDEREAALHQMRNDPLFRQAVTDEHVFEETARNRPVLSEDPAFVLRIIDATRRSLIAPQRAPAARTWKDFWLDLTNFLPVPHPAFAMLALALVGYIVGAMSGANYAEAATVTDLLSWDGRGLI